MSQRRAIPTAIAIVIAFAVIFLGLGNYLAARQSADSEERIAALSAEVELLRQRELQAPTGTAGTLPAGTASTPPRRWDWFSSACSAAAPAARESPWRCRLTCTKPRSPRSPRRPTR